MGKRRTASRKRTSETDRQVARRSESGQATPPRLPWAARVGEVLLVALVVAVPVVINHRSRSGTDVKDATLGLGTAAGLGVWLVAGLAQGKLSWVRSRLNLLVLAFAGWAAVSVCYARFWYVALSEFGRLAANVGIYLLAVTCLRTSQQVKRVAVAAVLGSVPVTIYALAQATGHDYMTFRLPPGAASRVFSFLGNPTYLGGYLILLIPMAIALTWPQGHGSERSSRRLVLLASALLATTALLMLLSLYLSYTMGAAIGLFLGLGAATLLALLRGGRKTIRLAVPALLAGMAVLAGLGLLAYRHMPDSQRKRVDKVLHFQDPYSRERQLHWRTAYALFRDSPIFGNGYGNFRALGLERMAGEWYLQAQERRQGMLALGYAHNEYLQVLSDTGLVGGVLFFALLGAVVATSIRVYWRGAAPAWRRLALAIFASCLAFLFQNIFGVTFHQTGAVAFFWLWLAVLAVASASVTGEPPAAELRWVKELRFRPLSAGGTAAAGLGLALLWSILAWQVINPIRASLILRASTQAAANAQVALGGMQTAFRRGDVEPGRWAQQDAIRWYQESALRARQAVDLCPYSAMGFYQLAFAEGQLGELYPPDKQQAQFEKALAASRRAVELMPGSGPMHYNLAVTYKRLGRLAEAEASFREAVRLSPSIGRHYAALAETLMEEGKLAEAEPLALKAAEMDRHDAGVQLFVAKLYSKMGDLAKTAERLEAAARLDPTDPSIPRQSAELWLEREQYDRALEASTRWIALDPDAAPAYRMLGVSQYRLRHYAEARAAFERALELDPDWPGAHLYVGLCLGALGEREAAVRKLQYVARTWPHTPEGAAARKTLKEIAQPSRPPAADSAAAP